MVMSSRPFLCLGHLVGACSSRPGVLGFGSPFSELENPTTVLHFLDTSVPRERFAKLPSPARTSPPYRWTSLTFSAVFHPSHLEYLPLSSSLRFVGHFL